MFPFFSDTPPTISYTYISSVGSTMFKYNKDTLQDINSAFRMYMYY